MKRILIAAAMVAPCLAIAQEPQIYAGANLGYYTLKEDGFGDIEPDFVTLGGKIGAKVHDNISAEFRLMRGLIEDESSAGGIQFETTLDHVAGVYVKLHAGDRVQPYLMAGYNQVSITVEGTDGISSASTSETETDTAFGFGVDFYAKENLALSLECANIYDKDDLSINGCNIGAHVIF